MGFYQANWECKFVGKDKGYFRKVCYVNSSGAICHWASKNLELPLVIDNYPLFSSREEESRKKFLSPYSQLPLTQNNT